MGVQPLPALGVVRWFAVLVVSALMSLAAWEGSSPAVAVAEEATITPPNIVVILTDDQGADMFDPMPLTRASLLDQGMTFTNGISPTSLCCPARAALLNGTYSHTNGVWTNDAPLGGWAAFSELESQTVATALDDAGYQTGFFGKYLNGWSAPADPVVPAGWDAFAAMRGPFGGGGSYYNYDLIGTSPTESHATNPEDYSTDVLAAKASSFVTASDPAAPFFVVYAPFGPHAPFTAAPRHLGLWPGTPVLPPKNESDMSDKPAFMQTLPLTSKRKLRSMIRKQNEALLSVERIG